MSTSKEQALEELVDMVELIYAAVKLHDMPLVEIEQFRLQKKTLKRGFCKGIYLNDIYKGI